MAQADAMRRGAATRREVERLRAEAAAARTEADESREKAKAATKDWPWKVIAAVTSVIALVTSAWVGWDATHFGAKEGRAEESRQKRAQIYADYLTAVRGFQTALVWYDLGESIRSLVDADRGNTPVDQLKREKSEADSQAAYDKVRAAEAAWRKQVDLVFVYGSQDAWKLSTEFEAALPSTPDPEAIRIAAVARSLSGKAGTPSPPRRSPDWERYERAEEGFRLMFCREVPAEPREGCR